MRGRPLYPPPRKEEGGGGGGGPFSKSSKKRRLGRAGGKFESRIYITGVRKGRGKEEEKRTPVPDPIEGKGE